VQLDHVQNIPFGTAQTEEITMNDPLRSKAFDFAPLTKTWERIASADSNCVLIDGKVSANYWSSWEKYWRLSRVYTSFRHENHRLIAARSSSAPI
jgi:hypothetical protein